VSLGSAIALYRDSRLASRNYASRTRREYLTDLRQLIDYLSRALTAAIKGTRGPRAIDLSGLIRTTVFRRRRTTGAFSSARAAIKIANCYTSLTPLPDFSGPLSVVTTSVVDGVAG
jgi:hypothetical protein